MPTIELFQLTQAIKNGDRNAAATMTEQGLAEGVGPEVMLKAMVAGMDDIGEKFKRNEVFVPEMLIAARAMKQAMAVLEPELVKGGFKPLATAVIGTVQGDLHDIGKNLVAMMWKGANLNVVDLGSNVPADQFVAAAKEYRPQVIGLSALLTTTMPAIKTTVEALRAAEINDLKIVIGGAPITGRYAEEIGADGFAPDAASAVDTVRTLLGV